MTVESDSSFPLKCKSCTNEARDILHHSVCLSGYKCVCLVHCVLSATVEADGSYVCLAWVTRHIYYSSSTQKKCFVLRPNIKHTHTCLWPHMFAQKPHKHILLHKHNSWSGHASNNILHTDKWLLILTKTNEGDQNLPYSSSDYLVYWDKSCVGSVSPALCTVAS